MGSLALDSEVSDIQKGADTHGFRRDNGNDGQHHSVEEGQPKNHSKKRLHLDPGRCTELQKNVSRHGGEPLTVKEAKLAIRCVLQLIIEGKSQTSALSRTCDLLGMSYSSLTPLFRKYCQGQGVVISNAKRGLASAKADVDKRRKVGERLYPHLREVFVAKADISELTTTYARKFLEEQHSISLSDARTRSLLHTLGFTSSGRQWSASRT